MLKYIYISIVIIIPNNMIYKYVYNNLSYIQYYKIFYYIFNIGLSLLKVR